jgi:hypothetical protein
VEAVKSWPAPTDKHQLRRILGPHTYYRLFIDCLAHIANPLMRLGEEKQTFEWSLEVETAFLSVKEVLCMAPVIGYSQTGKK